MHLFISGGIRTLLLLMNSGFTWASLLLIISGGIFISGSCIILIQGTSFTKRSGHRVDAGGSGFLGERAEGRITCTVVRVYILFIGDFSSILLLELGHETSSPAFGLWGMALTSSLTCALTSCFFGADGGRTFKSVCKLSIID